MKHPLSRLAAPLLLATPLLALAAPPPSIEDLLRRPQYESMDISPTGEYFATRVPLEDRTVLALIRRADMKVTASVDPDEDGFVDNSYWVNDTNVYVEWSQRFDGVAQPYSMRSTYSIDVFGKNRRSRYGWVVDPLLSDPDHVLMGRCVKVQHLACITRLVKDRIDSTRAADIPVVDGAMPDATFMVDRKGAPFFSWGSDIDDVQKLFLRRGDAWVVINDEAESGVEVRPVGISFDSRYGYLRSQRKAGPDVIEQIDLATGERRVAASHPERSPQRVVWSFDGNEPIGVVFDEGPGHTQFFDDKHPHAVLLRDLERAFPDERPVVTSRSKDGRTVLVTVVGDREPGRFYLLDTASGDLKLLARSRPWLAKESLSAMKPITLKARDGVTLEGFLTLPQAAAGAPAPLVVVPHGGPFGLRDTWGYDAAVQMLAARGYAVLQVNFRGSGGRGRDFMEKGYRQWGGLMQDDLTDATHWAMTQAGVDGSRVCVWGESYGGYAALMGTIREPDLYRCAIGMAGPYDLPTMFKFGDTHQSIEGKKFLKLAIGEDGKQLAEASPTGHAGEIKAALMLVQGRKDQRVSPMHARAMRDALDAVGKVYEGYFPNEETHGFYADKSRLEYYTRVFDFLDRHLKGGSAAAAPAASPASAGKAP